MVNMVNKNDNNKDKDKNDEDKNDMDEENSPSTPSSSNPCTPITPVNLHANMHRMIGCHVVLCNLRDSTKNNKYGIVKSFNDDECKYYVKLDSNEHVMVNPDCIMNVTVLD